MVKGVSAITKLTRTQFRKIPVDNPDFEMEKVYSGWKQLHGKEKRGKTGTKSRRRKDVTSDSDSEFSF